MPQVSVIMPLHNAEKYISEAINSVIAQTYNDWELIVVDDCSTDSSAAIVGDMAKHEPRITLLHTSQPSGSPTLPRNIALKQARGRFIAFLDSDDIWMPEKLEEQLQLFEHDDVKIVFSYYRKMDNNGSLHNSIIHSPESINYHQLLRGNVIGNLTGIYDTKKAGKHFFQNIGHEDYVFWLHILREGGVAVNTKKIHAAYRLTDDSVSRNKIRVLAWQWHIYRNIEHLSFLYASYCFICYAVKGIIKAVK